MKPTTPPSKIDGSDYRAWSEADLERLSRVTPEDRAAAKAFFRARAPKPLKNVLNAKPRRKPEP